MIFAINPETEEIMMTAQNNQFLVQCLDSFTGETWASFKTAKQLIDFVDLDDCYDFVYSVYDASSKFGEIKPLVVKGCWHDFRDPLKIVIEDEDGNVVLVGYGSDH